MKTFLLLVLGSFFFLQVTTAENGCTKEMASNTDVVSDTSDCGAAIIYQVDGDLISIQGVYANTTKENTTIQYRLYTEKVGPSGTSNNRQGGKKVVEAESRMVLSSTKLDYSPDNTYNLKLQIMDGENNTICEVTKELSE